MLGLLNMYAALFYIFAALTLIFGFLVVANPFSRNPVTSAMFLVHTIASLAGIFILLDAFYLAAVQVLVYAGAVIVLFLFVIMLLSLKEEERRQIRKFSLITGLISVVAITAVFARFKLTLSGHVMVCFIITVVATEVAVRRALIVALYRKRQTVHVEDLTAMKL